MEFSNKDQIAVAGQIYDEHRPETIFYSLTDKENSGDALMITKI